MLVDESEYNSFTLKKQLIKQKIVNELKICDFPECKKPASGSRLKRSTIQATTVIDDCQKELLLQKELKYGKLYVCGSHNWKLKGKVTIKNPNEVQNYCDSPPSEVNSPAGYHRESSVWNDFSDNENDSKKAFNLKTSSSTNGDNSSKPGSYSFLENNLEQVENTSLYTKKPANSIDISAADNNHIFPSRAGTDLSSQAHSLGKLNIQKGHMQHLFKNQKILSLINQQKVARRMFEIQQQNRLVSFVNLQQEQFKTLVEEIEIDNEIKQMKLSTQKPNISSPINFQQPERQYNPFQQQSLSNRNGFIHKVNPYIHPILQNDSKAQELYMNNTEVRNNLSDFDILKQSTSSQTLQNTLHSTLESDTGYIALNIHANLNNKPFWEKRETNKEVNSKNSCFKLNSSDEFLLKYSDEDEDVYFTSTEAKSASSLLYTL